MSKDGEGIQIRRQNMKVKLSTRLVSKVSEIVKKLLLEGSFYKDFFIPANDWKFAKEIHGILQNRPTEYKDTIKDESSVVYFIQEYLSQFELKEEEKWVEGMKVTRKITEITSYGDFNTLCKKVSSELLKLPLNYDVVLCTGLASDKIKGIKVKLSNDCEILSGNASPNQTLSFGKSNDFSMAMLSRYYGLLDLKKLGKGNILWVRSRFKGYINHYDITDTEVRVKREIMETIGLLYVYKLVISRQYFRKVALFPLHIRQKRGKIFTKEFDLEMSTALSNSHIYEELFKPSQLSLLLFKKRKQSPSQILQMRLSQLIKFLNYKDKTQKGYKRIKNALYWLVLAIGNLKPMFSLICLLTAIESVEGKLLNEEKVTNKQDHLASTVAALLASTTLERSTMFEQIKSFYDKRNKIVHDGEGDELNINEVNSLLVIALSLINKEISLLIS